MRDLQDDEPRRAPEPSREERKSGFKQMGSKAWTPIRAFRVPAGCGKLFQKLQSMNKHKVKGKVQACQVSDPEFGCDVFISYDADAPGAAKYNIQKGDHTPLTDDELKYLSWDLSNLMEAESLEVAKREAAALASKNPEDEGTEEEEEEDESGDALNGRRGSRSSRSERGSRSSRSERSSSRSERSERAGKTERGSRSERSERAGRSERSSRSERSERSSSRTTRRGR